MVAVMTQAMLTAQEVAENEQSPVGPYLIGGLVLGILIFAIVAVLIFGAGREHT
jgi:hypothetical protein